MDIIEFTTIVLENLSGKVPLSAFDVSRYYRGYKFKMDVDEATIKVFYDDFGHWEANYIDNEEGTSSHCAGYVSDRPEVVIGKLIDEVRAVAWVPVVKVKGQYLVFTDKWGSGETIVAESPRNAVERTEDPWLCDSELVARCRAQDYIDLKNDRYDSEGIEPPVKLEPIAVKIRS